MDLVPTRRQIVAFEGGQFPSANGSRYNKVATELCRKPRCQKSIVTGSNIYYEVHGSGPPLLLTHGYSSTSAMWQGQIEALSKHHKLVLWDMRGHGQSDYPDDPAAYSEALTVGDMAALLDKVGAEQRHRRRAVARRLYVAGVLSRASRSASARC